jgi:hypothetical protein
MAHVPVQSKNDNQAPDQQVAHVPVPLIKDDAIQDEKLCLADSLTRDGPDEP